MSWPTWIASVVIPILQNCAIGEDGLMRVPEALEQPADGFGASLPPFLKAVTSNAVEEMTAMLSPGTPVRMPTSDIAYR